MSGRNILADAESVLSKAQVPLAIRAICEKMRVDLKSDAREDLVGKELEQSLARNQKEVRPQFLKLGNCYGLGSWFGEWPPSVADLVHMVLLGNNRRPLHLTELAENVQSIRSLTEQPLVAVRVAVSSDKRFVSFGSGMYGLHGWKKYLENPNDFYFSTPARNWVVSQKLVELVEDADEILKIACPYIDKSTFEVFLARVPRQIRINLLVAEDNQMPGKVASGFTHDFISGWIKDRKMTTKRVADLHSRFVVVDNSFTIVMSTDLQRKQQEQKYQYLLLTSDSLVTTNCLEYFDQLWQLAEPVDLADELMQLEQRNEEAKSGPSRESKLISRGRPGASAP